MAGSQVPVTGSPNVFGILDPVRSSATDHLALRPFPTAADRTVVLVGGVPGAGKSTAIDVVAAERPQVDVIDSDMVRRWLRRRLPAGLPYRRFRWLVHTVTVLWTFAALLRGPRPGRRLIVHDPSTRLRRREVFVRLARRRGWRSILVLVDVARADAQRGQRDRQRVIRPAAFDRHWARWVALRREVVDAPDQLDGGRWNLVRLVDRRHAVDELRGILFATTDDDALPPLTAPGPQRRPHSGAPAAVPGLPMPI
jgi:predicted kinase